jgi:two-component system chemotaxis response regulator CheV
VSAPFLLVTFRVAESTFAFDVEDVVEVAGLGIVTRVPGTAERVLGVTSWRGRTLPVLLVSADLKREAAAPDQRCRLVVLKNPGAFAIRVDAPGQIIRDWTPIPDAPPGSGETRQLARVRNELVRVLDPRRVVGDPATMLLAGTFGGDGCASTP